jgi:toxin-antitoxin system PIN domain toxin
VLIDANLLIYSVDTESPFHARTSSWFTGLLAGSGRVALPWSSIGAFLRIMTHPRITAAPLTTVQAWRCVENWLSAEPVWVPPATERTLTILGRVMTEANVTSNLVPDAMVAALAIENGIEVATADTDFGRFREVRWVNPLTDRRG